MKKFTRIFLLGGLLGIFAFSGVGKAEDKLSYNLKTIKPVIKDRVISQGPESSLLTRSPWGPGLYRQTVNAVVLIIIPEELSGQDSMGSGVIVTQSGVIITNWHVVQDAPGAAIVFRPSPPKTLDDLKEEDLWVAKVLVTYPEKDLAFLRLVSSSTGSQNLPLLSIVPLENPNNLEIGQDVFAIGHPKGLSWTYTEGVISQIRPRFLWEMDGRKFRATVLQTQTDISFGSSGGPLINSTGKLVGIISNMMAGEAGFNFAISAHEIFELLGANAN